MQKIMALNTPFGTFCYQRLVMGYINATAEFQRHINSTLGDSLWREALAMVDSLLVASSSLAEHRVHMVSVLHKLAQMHRSLKPSKMPILREKVKYLGHVCTEKGLEPSNEHKEAIAKMPYPAYDRNGWWIEFGYETNRRQVRRCVISLKTILEHYGRFSDFLGRIRPNFS